MYDTQLEKLTIIRKGSDILSEQTFEGKNRYIQLKQIEKTERKWQTEFTISGK